MWWASSAPLANGAIGRPQHVELLVNTLGPPGARTILWDEFYHGHTRSFWSYLAATPFASRHRCRPCGDRRRWRSSPTPGAGVRSARRVVEPRTSPLEFVDTMGGLYERARRVGGGCRDGVRARAAPAADRARPAADDRRRAAGRGCSRAPGLRSRRALRCAVERARGSERSGSHRSAGGAARGGAAGARGAGRARWAEGREQR